MRKTKGIISN